MSTKDFKAGMAAGAKPFGEKLDQLANVNESGLNDITEGVGGIREVVDTLLVDLSAQEKKQLYDLDEAMDISVLDDDEKEFLVAVLTELANMIPNVSDLQKKYLLSICNVTNIASPQTSLNLACIENIENMKTQKILLRYAMEFLFIGEQGYNFLDTYEDDIFCYFSVNKRGVAEIKDMINRIFNAMGVEGIANRYAFEPEVDEVISVQPTAFVDNGVDLRARAEAAYLRYDIAEAIPFFTLMAEQGDSRSCYFLGNIYQYGYSGVVVPDPENAAMYWRQGADRGDPLCSLRFAEKTEDEGMKQSIYAWMEERVLDLAQNGDIFAMFEIARVYHFAYEAMQNTEQAIYWYTRASDAGLWSATNNLANLFFDQKAYEKAIPLYRKAADCGYESAIYNLAIRTWDGTGVEENEKKAIELLQKAAVLGFSKAMLVLGNIAEQKKDYEGAKSWYQKAIDQGDVSCYYDLARTYHFESVLPKSYMYVVNGEKIKINNGDLAWEALIRGATNGDKRAMVELAGHSVHRFLLIETIDKLRKLGRFEYAEIKIGDTEFTLEEKFNFALLEWGKEYLQEQAERGNIVAQYYWGMKCAEEYKRSKSSSDKKSAQRWLFSMIEQASNKVAAGDEISGRLSIALNDAKKVYQKVDKPFGLALPFMVYFVEED